MDVLRNSPEALPSDEILCHHVRAARIWEDVSIQFAMDDPLAGLSISDIKVIHQMKAFESKLEEWTTQIPEYADNGE